MSKFAWFLVLFLALFAASAASQPGPLVIASDTTLTADLTFSGSGIVIDADNVTLDGAGHTITGPGTAAAVSGIRSNGTGITIKNLTVTGFATGVVLVGGAGHRLEGCTIIAGTPQGNPAVDPNTVPGTGLRLLGVSDSTVTRNAIRDFWRNIFVIPDSTHNQLIGNTVTNAVFSGIQIQNGSANNLVKQNTITSQGGSGIVIVFDADRNLVIGNVVIGNVLIGTPDSWGLYLRGAPGLDPSDNLFAANAITGFRSSILVHGLEVTALGNRFIDNLAMDPLFYGLVGLHNASPVVVQGNTFAGGPGTSAAISKGLVLNSAQGWDLSDNAASGFVCGLRLSNGATDNVVRFNDLTGNGAAIFVDPSSFGNTFYGNVPEPPTQCGGSSSLPLQLSACELTALCATTVEGLELERGLQSSLLEKLSAAVRSCERGSNNAALGQLRAFANQVGAQAGKKLTQEEAETLLECSLDAVRLLSL